MGSLELCIVTFNCGRELIDSGALASQLFNGAAKLPDLLILSLQEIAPLAQSYIGGSLLIPYFAKFDDAVQSAAKKLGGDYTSIIARHVGMTAIMAFARDPAVIDGIETAGVGLGIQDTGNKGAVGLRLTYQDIDNSSASAELTFVAAHLAAMEGEVERRNEDWKNIVRGLVFSSTAATRSGQATSISAEEDETPLLAMSPRNAGIYKPTSHLFIAGDLNYRTSSLKPTSEDHKTAFPQPNVPESHPQHYTELLRMDELNRERAAGHTLHGLVEEAIAFPPTYKYDNDDPSLTLLPDSALPRWPWATHRWPSWCDRILYLPAPAWCPTAKPMPHQYAALPLLTTSDHRPVTLSFTVPLVPIPEPDASVADGGAAADPRVRPPFDINPDWKQRRQTARRYELMAGFSAYLTATWEGRGVVLATGLGLVGGYFVLKAALNF